MTLAIVGSVFAANGFALAIIGILRHRYSVSDCRTYEMFQNKHWKQFSLCF